MNLTKVVNSIAWCVGFVFTMIVFASASKAQLPEPPLGLWQMMNASDYIYSQNYTYRVDNQHHRRVWYREFDRINGIGANMMQGNMVNQLHWSRYHGDGSNNYNLKLLLEEIDFDSTSVWVNNRLRFIIQKYGQDSMSQAEAFSRIDTVISGIQDHVFGKEAFGAYNIDGEYIYKHGITYPAAYDRVEEAFEYAVERIRRRDHTSPIITSHGMNICFTHANYDTSIANSIFFGDNGDYYCEGWNVWEHFNYILENKGSQADYFGSRYQERWWKDQLAYYLKTSRYVEQYAENANYLGSEPEWWNCIQVQREWYTDTNSMIVFRFRRPSSAEYSMQAFSSIAGGARGITLWPYKSHNLPQAIRTAAPVEERLQSPVLDAVVNTGWTGLVSMDAQQIDTSYSPPRPNYGSIDNFRKPYSAALSYPDTVVSGELFYNLTNNLAYPYDDVAALYGNLGDLLPIIRELRWWYMMDGSDDTFEPVSGGNEQPNIWPTHLSIDSAMTTGSCYTPHSWQTVELGERFSLRFIDGEVEYPNDPNPIGYYSTIAVGCFDDPLDNQDVMAPEYYFLVNMLTHKDDGSGGVALADPQTVTLRFSTAKDTAYTISEVWADAEELNTRLVGSPTLQGGYVEQQLQLAPGDGILIKVLSEPSLRYGGTISSNITGPAVYTDDVTLSGSVQISGSVTFQGDLVVPAGATLTTNPLLPTQLQFDYGSMLHVQGGSLDLEGTADSPVTIRATDSSLGWDGIVFGTGISNSCSLDHVRLSDAITGIWAGGSTTQLDDVEIVDCGTGVVLASSGSGSFGAEIVNSHIHSCDNGIDALTITQQTGVSYTIQYTTVEDIAAVGIQALGVDDLTLDGVLIQSTGENGLTATSSYVTLETTSARENIFRRCGLDSEADDFPYSAVQLNGATALGFHDCQIYENEGPGLTVMAGTVFGRNLSSDNLIANNALAYRAYDLLTSSPQDYSCNTEIRVVTLSELRFGNSSTEVLDTWLDGTGSHNFLSWEDSGTLHIGCEQTFWSQGAAGSLTGITNSTTLKNDHMYALTPGASIVLYTGTGLSATQHSLSARYWSFTQDGVSDPYESLALAYSYLDDDQPQQARDLFAQLAQTGMTAALSGYCTSLHRLGITGEGLESALMALEPADPEAGYEQRRDLVIGHVKRNNGDFDSARSWFESVAEGSATLNDSVSALIEVEHTTLIEQLQMSGEFSDSTGIESLQNNALRIQETRERIQQLERLILGNDTRELRSVTVPTSYELGAAYPNPFNPSVTIPFALPERGHVTLKVYNSLGQRIATLVDRTMASGHHSIVWQGNDSAGMQVSSGLYFIQMQADGFVKTSKVVMLK